MRRVACMGEMQIAYKISVRELEGKKPQAQTGG
jgi:hypothetical protein